MSKATTRAGRRADIDKSDVSFYVNISYFEVVDQLPDELREQIAVSSTTSGEYRVTLPTDFDAPINVSILSNSVGGFSDYTLIQVDPSYVDHQGFFPAGIPQRYVLYGDFLELHPSPNSAYSLQIRYTSRVTDLTAEADVPSIHTSARKAILYLTESEIFADVGDDARAASRRAFAFNYLSTLQNKHSRRMKAADRWGVRPIYPEARPASKRSFDIV
jgi:hypothetical protein